MVNFLCEVDVDFDQKGAQMKSSIEVKSIPLITDADLQILESALGLNFELFFVTATNADVQGIFGA
jgi:hypothetical protein